MQYPDVVQGRFLSRPNRFIAHIQIGDTEQVCHVKNTGRCRELLPPGAVVYCAKGQKPNRKTPYDLIAVQKGDRLINMDSQAPNEAVKQWLLRGGLGEIQNLKPETKWGTSRFDFSFQKDGRLCFLEVKGVTLETDGVCAFPDAPTQRGTRHLTELTELARQGYGAYVLFVIQMDRVKYLRPNWETDEKFARALKKARDEGVWVMARDCAVTPNSMQIGEPVEVRLQ